MAATTVDAQVEERRPRKGAGALPGAELDFRPSYVAAAVAAALVFVLYIVTLAPSTAMWDASEYIAAAYTLGLPHPPGNPFFVLIGRVFTMLPVAPNIAMRVNVLAALCSAVAAGMWFLIAERVLVSWLAQRWQRIVGGALAVLISATAYTVWNQSVVNEKVYTVSLAFFAIVAWLAVRWSDDPDHPRANRLLVLIGFLLGLGYANHPAGFLPLPAVGLAVLIRKPTVLLRWKLLIGIAAATLLGMTPFAMQPIRAAYNPPINEGEPTACRDGLKVSCTFSSGTWTAFKYNFNREQYAKPSLVERQAPLGAQVGMWWLYFKWQWLRDAHDEKSQLQSVLAALFLVLGLFGGYVHWRRDKQSFWFFGPLMGTLTLALIYYLNFKYGASQSPELGDSVQREVRDRDYFYIWSYSAWGVWASLGLVFIWESIASLLGSDPVKIGRETIDAPRQRSWLLASPILALALVPLFGNWSQASRAGHTDTADFARDLLNSVEPYGILVTVGDNDTFPLWYAQEVEGIRRDVIIANTSLLNTDWYTRQLIKRPVFDYDEAKGPAIYRGRRWEKPQGPPLKMSLDDADKVPPYVELREAQVFRHNNIVATVEPRILTRADIFVLQMIKDNDRRPVHFSRTSGGYGQELGLQQYLITQGLARKLMDGMPAAAGKDTVIVPGEGWVDVARTKALWDGFQAPKALIKRGDWVDKPSVGIPYLYVTTGAILAETLERNGDKAGSAQALATAEQIAKATRLDDVFQLTRAQTQSAPAQDTGARTAVPLGPKSP